MTDAAAAPAPPFFAVSTRKFVILSFATLGLYQFYWFYENWRCIRDREEPDILPFWRAFFSYFFIIPLLLCIHDYPRGKEPGETLPAVLLGVAWIVVNLLWKLPEPYNLVTLGTPLFLVPAQLAAQKANDLAAPGHERNDRLTLVNWVWIVVGTAFLILAIIGTFVPDPDTDTVV
ncbi:MAG: hypothetical protein JSS29_02205 [Proteobacteria bacterium]|nr:hypothetical protein [Pseudomonadota bacterium]